jgi:hypothetical protein
MSEHYTVPLFTGISCDATGCDAGLRTPEPLRSWSEELRRFMAQADAAGWRFYVNRSRRVYCPAHGPRPGHKMWLVTP